MEHIKKINKKQIKKMRKKKQETMCNQNCIFLQYKKWKQYLGVMKKQGNSIDKNLEKLKQC